MRSQLFISVVLLLSGSIARANSTAAAKGSITASTAATQGTIVVPAVAATGAIDAAITPEEKKTLLSEFNRAQSNEEKAFNHTSRSQMKELTAAQSQRKRTWYEQEKRLRREFFAQHTSGPERREYVQSYIQRKKDFDQSIKNEYNAAKKIWSEKSDRLKTKQKEQRAAFKAVLEQKKRPDASYWPN